MYRDTNEVKELEKSTIKEWAKRFYEAKTSKKYTIDVDDDIWKESLSKAEQRVKDLRNRISEILFYIWDPIGISHANWSRDEYIAYEPEVFRLLIVSDSHEPIADYLTKISSEYMLEEIRERDIETAKLIFSLLTGEIYFMDKSVIMIKV